MAVTSASENEGQKIINYDDLLSGNKLEKMKEAAVLICFYKQNDEYYFPLIKRPMHEKNHPGQIALPGGSKENNESLEETALREAFEEVGIEPESVKLLGKLTPLPFSIKPSLVAIQSIVWFETSSFTSKESLPSSISIFAPGLTFSKWTSSEIEIEL